MYSRKGTKTFSKTLKSKTLILALSSLVLLGCKGITEVDSSKNVRRNSIKNAGTNQAFVYSDNPILLTGNTNLNVFDVSDVMDVGFITSNNYLEKDCSFSQKTGLTTSITDTTNENCLFVLNDKSTTTQAIQSQNGSWTFEKGSDEFYQVNLFYHLQDVQDRYLEALSWVHEQVHFNGNMSLPPATKYNLYDTQTYWLTNNGATSTLRAHSKCLLNSLNAFFSPADDTLCFGYNDTFSSFRMVQDPSIVYHEFAHVVVKALMNQRNVTKGFVPPAGVVPFFEAHSYASDLGSIFYDEAGAINEGIADYFSYMMNQRERIGEWGLGAVYAENDGSNIASKYRPMSENDAIHSADVAAESGKRLSYPQFVQYDANFSNFNIEGVHNAGMIVSHYLVSLTKEFKNQCTFSTTDSDEVHKQATNYVMLLLSETLAEIGDLTGKGSDILSEYATNNTAAENVYFTNLNQEESFLWTQVVNPPNFRRFFRIFGKNILHHISTDLCPGFSLDESERLLDDYGLLLFKSYEDRGNGMNAATNNPALYFTYNGRSVFAGRGLNLTSNLITNNMVNEDNRRNTVLVSKDFIEFDDEAIAYIFDGQTDIANFLSNLTFEGENVTTTQGIAGTEYNNNNVKISPGEVVGISLNLKNTANSTMGGVQILANDWDHMKLINPTSNTGGLDYNYVARDINMMGLSSGGAISVPGGFQANHAPCIIDDFPSSSEGGVTDTATTPGNCGYISRNNYDFDLSKTDINGNVYPRHRLDAPQPICLVEFNDTNETKWVSQEKFRSDQMNLEDKDCLNNPSMSGNNFNPNECLIRVLPGAAQSVLGKIDPGKTWAETIQTDSNQDVEFTPSNIFLIEVNKWIPPGTRFNCRTRVRFTNCIDCYNVNNTTDDYADYQYAGQAPYKVINFQFTVND